MARFAEEMERLANGIARGRELRLGSLQQLRDETGRLRAGAQARMESVRAAVAGSTADQKEHLREFAKGLRQASRLFLRNARRLRMSAGKGTREEVTRFVASVRSRVNSLLAESREFLNALRSDYDDGADRFRRPQRRSPAATHEEGSAASQEPARRRVARSKKA